MSVAIEQKKAVVEELAGKMDGAVAFYLTDFTGIDVQGMTDLRARLRAAGVEYLVVKNTLARRALESVELPDDLAEFFVGPTGLVIGRDDAVMPAKVIDEFAREHDDRPKVKVGVVERRTMSAEDVARLAKLPPREQLYAELAGAMEAPLSQLAMMMQNMLGEFVGLLDALRGQKENE